MGTTSKAAKDSWANAEIRQRRIDAMRAAKAAAKNKTAIPEQKN